MNARIGKWMMAIRLAAALCVTMAGMAMAGEPGGEQGQRGDRRGQGGFGGVDFRDVMQRMVNVSEDFALKRLPADAWIVNQTEPGKVSIDSQANTCLVQSGKGGAASLETNARGSVNAYAIRFSARVQVTDLGGKCSFGLASDDPARAAVLVENDGKDFLLKMRGGAKEETAAFAPFDDAWHNYEIRVSKTGATLSMDGAELAKFESAPPTAALAAFFGVRASEDNEIEIDHMSFRLTPPDFGRRDRGPGGGN